MANETLIMNKLNTIEIDLRFIKEHIEDITLTEDDLASLKDAEKDLKEGKTISHEKLKEELGI